MADLDCSTVVRQDGQEGKDAWDVVNLLRKQGFPLRYFRQVTCLSRREMYVEVDATGWIKMDELDRALLNAGYRCYVIEYVVERNPADRFHRFMRLRLFPQDGAHSHGP